MTSQLFPVLLFLVALGCIPFLIRWLKARVPFAANARGEQSRIVSAVAVGPHQRVVTVEIGPKHERVWLTVGVSASGIQCLHTVSAPPDRGESVDVVVTPGNTN